jgi:hypothetical protein
LIVAKRDFLILFIPSRLLGLLGLLLDRFLRLSWFLAFSWLSSFLANRDGGETLGRLKALRRLEAAWETRLALTPGGRWEPTSWNAETIWQIAERATEARAASIGVRFATSLVKSSGSRNLADQSGVDTEAIPSEDSFLNRITEKNVFGEGIGDGGLLGQDEVVGIGREEHLVGSVGLELLNLRNKVVVEVHLADVGDVEINDGVVLADIGVKVDHEMDVGGTTLVVAGEDGLKLGGAVGVCRLVTTMEGGVEISGIG